MNEFYSSGMMPDCAAARLIQPARAGMSQQGWLLTSCCAQQSAVAASSHPAWNKFIHPYFCLRKNGCHAFIAHGPNNVIVT
jgi:hypothetical protein